MIGTVNAKKLLHLPTLHKGSTWPVYDSLGADSIDTYAHLKSALFQHMYPDTEDHLAACEQLSKRKLQEEKESIDKVICDLEKLLDKASLGLPAEL